MYFYSHEPGEPPHVHIDRDEATAKFWLENLGLASSSGFSARDLGELQRMVRSHRAEFLEAWHGFFGTSR